MADTVAIGRFSAGLHTELDPAQLPDGASPDVMNVMTHRGDLRVRPGRQVTTDLPVAGPTALTEYVHDDGARLLAAAGGKVYATGANTTAFADTGMAVNAGNRPRLSQFKDTAYCVDGVGSVRTWNPTAGAKTLEQLIKPYHDFTKIEQTNTNTNLGDLTTGTDTGIGAGQYGAVYPMTGYYWNVKYFQDPATEFKAYPQQNKYFDEFFGTTCRLFHTITDYEEKAMDSVLGLEIIGRPTDQSFSAHSMMRQYIATGIYQDGMDLSQATILELTYKVIAAPGSDMPGITLHFGEDNDISHDATLIVCAPGDTTDQVNNWVVKKQVDLTQLLPAQLNSVKWIGIDIYNGGTDHGGTRETARLEMTDGTFLHTTSTGVTFLLSELSVNLYQSNFLPGQEYDLCYTYTYGDEESAASSVHLYPINSDAFIVPSNLLISIPRITTVSDTDQTPITPPDKASLYARGGLLGTEFVLIDTIDFATATANEDGS
ncbi:MAG TPA: hypothetical protein VHV83_09170 [Armatimonadota bacterium]|nr:hypothetical protein [Armatimonadota bacterium]